MKILVGILILSAAQVAANPLELHLSAGGTVLTSTNNDSSVEPFASIDVRTDLADTTHSPQLKVYAELTAYPGSEISFDDPGSIRSVETVLRLSQPLSEILYFRPYVEIGFSTKLPGETQVRNRTARFWSAGLEIGDAFNALSVGLGTDQRLDSTWSPVVSVNGRVRLKETDHVDLSMVGKAVLDMQLYKTNRRDVVLIGFAVGN